MNDHELLKLAAKAAGITAVYEHVGVAIAWNPLTDDGDALRLAVKLRLEVDCEGDEIIACTYRGSHIDKSAKEKTATNHNKDRTAAARRAIVRAAAEIGRNAK